MNRYCLKNDYTYHNENFRGISFENHICKIENETITIFAGYAWDGCSPTFKIGPFWLGTPDGERGIDGVPLGYYPSLVHDCLCQFMTKINITKKLTDYIFYEMLLEHGMSSLQANIYHKAVKWFGPNNFKGDR